MDFESVDKLIKSFELSNDLTELDESIKSTNDLNEATVGMYPTPHSTQLMQIGNILRNSGMDSQQYEKTIIEIQKILS